jgi:hypothetical protein
MGRAADAYYEYMGRAADQLEPERPNAAWPFRPACCQRTWLLYGVRISVNSEAIVISMLIYSLCGAAYINSYRMLYDHWYDCATKSPSTARQVDPPNTIQKRYGSLSGNTR